MYRKLCGLVLLLVSLVPLDGVACNVVYGKDWAFVSKSPTGWSAACGQDALDETALTLWPSEQDPANVHVVIYVTVSGKDGMDLPAFVADEINRFKRDAGDSVTVTVDPVQDISSTRKLVHVGHSVGGRDELVEYVEGPTAYYIVVLSTESPTATTKYTPAFNAFLDSFSPASITQGGG